MHYRTAMEAVGTATLAMHCHTAWGQWAVQLLGCNSTLPGGSGQWSSCNALLHRQGAVGSGSPAMQCLTAWQQWAVQVWCGVVWCGVVWCGVM